MKMVFLMSAMASFAVLPVDGGDAEGLRSKWKDWKDPLSEEEIKELMKRDMHVDRALVEKSRKVRAPLESTVKFEAPATFLGRTFGEIRSVNTGSYMLHNDVLEYYYPTRGLDEAYFAFGHVVEYMSPKSHRLYRLSFGYMDYGYGSQGVLQPLGRYKSGTQLLEEGRAILADLERRLGAPLQKLQFMSQIWPYRPGMKMSGRFWSGPLPEYYICDESAWPTSRHAMAISNTNLGRLNVRLALTITYYDEYSLSLDITDKVETGHSRGEYEEEVRRRNGAVEKRNKYEEEFPQIEVEFPE